MSAKAEQGEPGDPEPLETAACLVIVGFTVAALLELGDALRCLEALRRWW